MAYTTHEHGKTGDGGSYCFTNMNIMNSLYRLYHPLCPWRFNFPVLRQPHENCEAQNTRGHRCEQRCGRCTFVPDWHKGWQYLSMDWFVRSWFMVETMVFTFYHQIWESIVKLTPNWLGITVSNSLQFWGSDLKITQRYDQVMQGQWKSTLHRNKCQIHHQTMRCNIGSVSILFV